MREEWEFDVLAIIQGGLRSEVDLPEALAIALRETAMVPRPHHERLHLRGTVLLHKVVLAEKALRVLVIIPAANQHNRGLDVAQIFPDGAGLPDLVVGGVIDIEIPEWLLMLEILLIRIGQGTHLQVEIVAILRAVLKW